MANHIDWQGNVSVYRYWFLDTPSDASSIKPEGGNYIFVRPTEAGWIPVYVGIADNLSTRIPYHERWADALRAGATRVMAHTEANALRREAEERDLIARWSPVLNSHHMRPARKLGGLNF